MRKDMFMPMSLFAKDLDVTLALFPRRSKSLPGLVLTFVVVGNIHLYNRLITE